MSRYKIIFFDIDGTLIDMKKGRMTERMEDTLIRLKENGVLICLATGRPVTSIPKFGRIDFDVTLAFNGSYCFCGKDVIYKQPIAHEDVLKIIENAKGLGRPVAIATANRSCCNGADRDLIEYYGFAHQVPEVSSDFDILVSGDIYQVMMGGRREEYGAILRGVSSAKITAWWDRAVDIIPAHSGKGEAIKKVLAYYGIDRADALAFGDGENDIEMLQEVGLGVAMGNADDHVKAMADDVCGNVEDEGIYHYCKRLGLI